MDNETITNVTLHGATLYNATDLQKLQNMPLEEYLMAMMGPRRQENESLLMFVTVFYVVVFISGLLGNLSVIAVVIRSKGLHSAMNYYLISLAIADILIIILGVPNELLIYWHQYPYPFGENFCQVRSFLSEGASYASVLTILSFSLERYLAICTPLYIFPLSDIKRAAIVSVLCWTIALAASVPHLAFTKINYIEYPIQSERLEPESAFCAMMDDNISPKWYPIHELSFLIFFLIPIIFLSFFYVRMILTIRKANNSNLRRSAYRGSNKMGVAKPPDHRKQTIRMLVSVVVLFFVSWSPFHFQRITYVYFKTTEWHRTVNQYLFYFSGFLYYLSSTLNPLLYTILSVKYRESFKKVILCKSTSRRPTYKYNMDFTNSSKMTMETQLSTRKSSRRMLKSQETPLVMVEAENTENNNVSNRSGQFD